VESNQVAPFTVHAESTYLIPFVKPAIDIIKGGLRAARKTLWKRKHDQLISAVIAELLKEDPDIDMAEAKLIAARATGVQPDMNLLRAQKMLSRTKLFAWRDSTRVAGGGMPAKLAKKKWAKPSKKKTKRPSRAAKSRKN
jgi:hypothetical protein